MAAIAAAGCVLGPCPGLEGEGSGREGAATSAGGLFPANERYKRLLTA